MSDLHDNVYSAAARVLKRLSWPPARPPTASPRRRKATPSKAPVPSPRSTRRTSSASTRTFPRGKCPPTRASRALCAAISPTWSPCLCLATRWRAAFIVSCRRVAAAPAVPIPAFRTWRLRRRRPACGHSLVAGLVRQTALTSARGQRMRNITTTTHLSIQHLPALRTRWRRM